MLSKLSYYCITLLLLIIGTSANAFASTSHWADYREPLIEPMKTCLEGEAHLISVTLPSEFLWRNVKIQLAIQFKSETSSTGMSGIMEKGFHGYAPYVKINKSFFKGYYQVTIPETPASQKYLLEIDSSNFVPGKNIIKLGFANYPGSKKKCPDKCCPCIFEKIEFRQATFPFVNVKIASTPKGSSVYIDDVRKGKTPLTIRLPSRDYKLRIEKKGYTNQKKKIHVSSVRTHFQYTLKANSHMVAVKTNIKDTKVYVDGKYIGKTPLSVRLALKSYQFTFMKEGYSTKNKTVTIGTNNKRVSIDLENGVVPITTLPEKVTPIKETVEKKVKKPSKFGEYYGLIVGNNTYKHLTDLKTAINDAQEFSTLLEEHYGFSNTVLLNASRKDILLAFQHYRETLTENDNLLIYFAGHNSLDTLGEEGYWLPTDAEKDNKLNWVSNSFIMATLRALQARHVLIIADSWYSDSLTRGIKPIFLTNPAYRERILKKRSRSAITSGGVKPVTDAEFYPDHSIFAHALISRLQDNTGIMDATQLFSKIRRPVLLNSNQTPHFSEIKKAGHDGGEFFFIRQ